jgi:hypothetical protein
MSPNPGLALTLAQCDPAAYVTVLAARVGTYQFHPYWGLLTGLLWVRCGSR